MAEEDASLREQQPWKAAHEKDYAWLGGAIDKHYAGDDSDVKVLIGGDPAGVRRTDGRGVRGRRRGVPRRGAASLRSAGGSVTAATRRWSSCCATSRRTASRATSPRAATATSCARSPARSTASRRERVIGSSNGLELHRRRARRGARLSRRARRLRRRARQAGADLEPDRAPADPRRRQLQRRRPDAPLRGRQRQAGAAAARPPRRRRPRVRLHQRAPSTRSSRRARTAGRSSA